MTVVVKLEPATARSLRNPGEVEPPITEVLARLRVRLTPMHPAVDDEALATYYSVEGAEAADEDEIARTLRAAPGVDGAYVKPPAEPA